MVFLRNRAVGLRGRAGLPRQLLNLSHVMSVMRTLTLGPVSAVGWATAGWVTNLDMDWRRIGYTRLMVEIGIASLMTDLKWKSC